MAEAPATVYVLDDDLSVSEAIGDLLAATGLNVRLFETPEALMNGIQPGEASCLILDLCLRGANGLDVQKELDHKNVNLPIIFLSGQADIPMSVKAMKAGAIEFLVKPFQDAELLNAVHQAIALDGNLRRRRLELSALQSRYALLTPREREVMKLVVSGMLNKQIAFALGTKQITVKIQRGRVMRKMNAESITDLVRMAQRLDISLTARAEL